jgi:hypothetical protein
LTVTAIARTRGTESRALCTLTFFIAPTSRLPCHQGQAPRRPCPRSRPRKFGPQYEPSPRH